MITHIRTSKVNREKVTQLTRRLALGAENTVARMALSYSLSKDRKLDLGEIQDAGGKEYAKSVLFGNHYEFYTGMVCVHYGIHSSSPDLAKYVKMHIDDGLELLDQELQTRKNVDAFDFINEKIEIL